MPFVLKPGRNATLKLAYALMEAEAKKAKKAAKEPEPAEPVKKQPARKGKKT
jgi:hypothetical protein